MNTLQEGCSPSPEVPVSPSEPELGNGALTPSRGLRRDLRFIYTASITNTFAWGAFKETRRQTPGEAAAAGKRPEETMSRSRVVMGRPAWPGGGA